MLFLLRLAVALALPPVLGWLWLRLLMGRSVVLARLDYAAAAWCLGWGMVTVGMLGLGLSGLIATPWRPLPLFGVWLVPAVAAMALIAWRRQLPAISWQLPADSCRLSGVDEGAGAAAGQRKARGGRGIDPWRAAGALVAIQCAVVSLHMVAWPVKDWDAWSIWAFKARVFYLSQGIPAAYFHDASKLFSHPDYPLLVPLAETWIDGWLGQANSWAIMLLFPFFFLGIVAFVAGALGRTLGPRPGLAGAAALVCVPYVMAQGGAGDADIPVALMTTGSAVFLWQWLRRDDAGRALLLCGLLAGLAAWTKKEGLLLLPITALVVALASWRRQGHAPRWRAALLDVGLFLAPALLVDGPWLIFLALRHPLSRDFLPFTPETLAAHLDRLPTIAALVTLHLVDVWRWNAVWLALGALVILRRRALGRGGPLLYLLLLLVLRVACDGGLFVFSDWQPYTDHLQGALDRLLLQAVPLAVVVLIGVAVDTA